MPNSNNLRPAWTLEEARAFAVKGNIRKKELAREREASTAQRIANLEAELAAALARIPLNDDARRQKTLDQIDATDKMINAAIREGDREAFIELTDAKQKLWKLTLSTPGALKTGRRAAMPAPLALPVPRSDAIPSA